MCLFRSPVCVKPLSHTLHVKGLSPVCVLMCVFSCPVSVKPLPHTLHVKGLSPVCVLMCVFSCPVSVKPLPHTFTRKRRLPCMCPHVIIEMLTAISWDLIQMRLVSCCLSCLHGSTDVAGSSASSQNRLVLDLNTHSHGHALTPTVRLNIHRTHKWVAGRQRGASQNSNTFQGLSRPSLSAANGLCYTKGLFVFRSLVTRRQIRLFPHAMVTWRGF